MPWFTVAPVPPTPTPAPVLVPAPAPALVPPLPVLRVEPVDTPLFDVPDAPTPGVLVPVVPAPMPVLPPTLPPVVMPVPCAKAEPARTMATAVAATIFNMISSLGTLRNQHP